jgi:hypothetical protein
MEARADPAIRFSFVLMTCLLLLLFKAKTAAIMMLLLANGGVPPLCLLVVVVLLWLGSTLALPPLMIVLIKRLDCKRKHNNKYNELKNKLQQ